MPEEPRRDSQELEHYVTVLQRHWQLLLVGVAVPAVAALAYIGLTPRVYEATTTLIAVHVATGDEPADPASTATARALFDSRIVAARVLQEFQLHQGRAALTPSTFLRDVLRVDEVRGTSLLRVSVRLSDPELAARVANRVSESVIERSGRVAQGEAAAERTVLKAQLEEAEASLQAAEKKLLADRAEARGDRLRQESRPQAAQRAEAPRLPVEFGMSTVEIEHYVLTTIYADLARQYHKGRLDMLARATELQVFEPAVAPAQPAFPRPGRILAIALLGGLIVSIVGIFILDAVQQGRAAAMAEVAVPHGRPRAYGDASVAADRHTLLNARPPNGG
jgi:uncharacterized protein involved in exopolysaccharide biosynthesis